MAKVILASQSKQRKALLESLGFAFDVQPANLDELAIDHADHVKRAAMVAQAKADKIHHENTDAIILACDTFVLLGDRRLEKPLSLAEAREMLTVLSEQEMTVLTGWAYIDPARRISKNDTAQARLKFRKLRPAEIETYITKYPVMRWAAAFSVVDAMGRGLIADFNGSLTALEGLPLEVFIPLLEESGVLI